MSHVALRDCVLYCVCNARYEGSNDSGFFSHSEGAIDTQRDYRELTGAAYACQMTVMPVVIRVPSGLLNAKSAAAQKRARAVALRGEKKEERCWESDDARVMGVRRGGGGNDSIAVAPVEIGSWLL